jgi:hypothetical protein
LVTLYNEELNDLYCSSNVVQVIQIERNEMGGVCSAYGERAEAYTGFCVEDVREGNHLEDPSVDGRII